MAPLSRKIIVQHAVALADQSGLDGLSMRKLAARCGVEAMSLYNHVDNKDDVLDGMVEYVIGKVYVPRLDADWRQEMRQRAVSAHALFLQHPWASKLIVSRVNSGPGMFSWVDGTIGCLRAAGFSWAQADAAWNAMDSFIHGFTLQRLNFPFKESEYAQAAAAWLPNIPPDEYPNLHGMASEVADGRHSGIPQFTFGLDILLDGLERLRNGTRSK
jgi:AcrR family transcriptional regulator